jgi:molybdenum cofactor guanylyltransferase
MGSDKGFIEFRGKRLADRAVETLGVFCSKIMISSNDDAYSILGYPIIRDLYEGIGPIGGVYSCLKASSTEWNALLAVDMPFVTPGLFNRLVKECHNFDAVIPVNLRGQPEPLCGLYSRRLLPIVKQCINERHYKMADMAMLGNTFFVRNLEAEPEFSQDLFANLNTTKELGNYE